MSLQPHQQRIINEHSELHIKCEALNEFINKNRKFYEQSTHEQHLQVKQLGQMEAYLTTLADRMRAFQG